MARTRGRAGGVDRTVRSLVALQSSGSTARTLNLVAVWRAHGDTAEYRDAPFFKNRDLNRSIVLKHRLREYEKEAFNIDRTTVTKVIVPIDFTNLAAGGRSLFVEQRGYRDILKQVLSGSSREEIVACAELLRLLDDLPSLDPFLMRERLKRSGLEPARCYFAITKGDMDRMSRFVCDEVTPLIGMSFGGDPGQVSQLASKLADKLMSNAGDAELGPLREGLGMDKATFEEGVFCWKGFLYFKWLLIDLLPQLRPLGEEISAIKPKGFLHQEDRRILAASALRIRQSINASCDTVRETLKIYDDAYGAITHGRDPQAFRDFLLTAPRLFNDLGERLGTLQHMISFWRYRFPANAKRSIAVEELIDLFNDFEASISVSAR